ncbi:hypothetical protein Pelo_15571 [Pelomyxa schiedti]|nr:hypothetical protein Pelo_15571 [Pelomyxa schiedti]
MVPKIQQTTKQNIMSLEALLQRRAGIKKAPTPIDDTEELFACFSQSHSSSSTSTTTPSPTSAATPTIVNGPVRRGWMSGMWRTAKEARESISELCGHQIVPPFWPPPEQFGGPIGAADSALRVLLAPKPKVPSSESSGSSSCWVPSERLTDLKRIRDGTLAKLEASGVDPESLKVVLLIAPGGAPVTRYCFGREEEAIQSQFTLAKNHGMLFDAVPLFAGDFSGNSLAAMTAVIGAAVYSKLMQRDAGMCKVDGILFGSKGTAPVALGVMQYCKQQGSKALPIPLIGMGTDMQYMYNNCSPLQMTVDDISRLSPILMVNSKQDTSLDGTSRESLERFISTIPPSPLPNRQSREVLLDVEANYREWFPNPYKPDEPFPHHGWFIGAFSDATSYVTLAQAILLPLIAQFTASN